MKEINLCSVWMQLITQKQRGRTMLEVGNYEEAKEKKEIYDFLISRLIYSPLLMSQ